MMMMAPPSHPPGGSSLPAEIERQIDPASGAEYFINKVIYNLVIHLAKLVSIID